MVERYGETVVLRSRPMQVIGAAMVAAAALGLASAIADSVDAVVDVVAPVVLFGLFGWAGFWRPRVEVADGGVTLVNTLRTVEIPWPAIVEVEGRYGLQLRTAYGAFTAWGVSAPSGLDRTRSHDSRAAVAVRERLAALRNAGWLDDPRLERPTAQVRWHGPLIGAVLALAVASVALPLLS